MCLHFLQALITNCLLATNTDDIIIIIIIITNLYRAHKSPSTKQRIGGACRENQATTKTDWNEMSLDVDGNWTSLAEFWCNPKKPILVFDVGMVSLVASILDQDTEIGRLVTI